MHEDIRPLVENEWNELFDEVGQEQRGKLEAIKNGFALRGLLEGPGLHFALASSHFEAAAKLARERCRLWCETIEASQGYFSQADAAFVQQEVEGFIAAQRDHARRAAHSDSLRGNDSAALVQSVDFAMAGMRGTLHRALERRVLRDSLRKKVESRAEDAEFRKRLQAEVPLWVAWLLGRRRTSPRAVDVVTAAAAAFSIAGGVRFFIEIVDAIETHLNLFGS